MVEINQEEIQRFGHKVREYTKSIGVSHGELANELTVHPSTLTELLFGRNSRKGEKPRQPDRNILHVKGIIKFLAQKEAVVSVEEAIELLVFAYPNESPIMHRFTPSERKEDWYAKLENDEDAAPYTYHREQPKPKRQTKRNNSLPMPQAPLIGREKEIERIISFLSFSDVRLVTLKGAGGVGKTSLALEVLQSIQNNPNSKAAFYDGLVYVPLLEATTTEQMIAAILQVLKLTPAPVGSVKLNQEETLTNFLVGKSMLIMLDNFEQLLLDSVGSGSLGNSPKFFLSNLLFKAPGVKLLITSQERLRIYREQVVDVKPLKFPSDAPGELGTDGIAATVDKYPAVRLFVERAAQVDSGFTLTSQNAKDIFELCRYLDGLPIFLEQAAANLDRYSPAQMVNALKLEMYSLNSLGFLDMGACDLPQRHQSLKGMGDWSYRLLGATEQTVFRRLSVFEGGFSSAVADEVCGFGQLTGMEVPQIVARLLDKSLLKPVASEGDNEPRYSLQEAMRHYARLVLKETGESAETRERHVSYFLELAREAEPHLTSADRTQWQEKLKTEYANLCRTLNELITRNKVEEATELAGILGNFVVSAASNYRSEIKIWLQKVLTVGLKNTKVNPEIRAKALHQAGRIAVSEKELWQAQGYFEEAVILWEKTGNLKGLCLSLLGLGNIAFADINYKLATDFYIRAEQAARHIEDKQSLSSCLNNLASIAFANEDYHEAKLRFEEVYVLKREINDKSHIATILKNLAVIAIRQKEFEKARLFSQQSSALNESLERKAENTANLYNLGEIEQLQNNNFVQAQAYFIESLRLSLETSNYRYVPALLNKTATLVLTLKKIYHIAAKLYGMVEKNMEAQPDLFDSADRLEYNKGVSLLEQYLSKEVIQPGWLEGRDIGTDLRKAALFALSSLTND